MQKRLVGIVLFVVAVAVLAVLLWRTLVEPPERAALGDEAAQAPRSAPVQVLDANAERPDGEADRLPAAASPAGDVARDDEDLSILVRVVDGVTELPVPGARLLYWDEAAWAERLAVPADSPLCASGDEEDLLRTLGRIAHCDGAGETTIRISFWADVLAEFEGAVGVGHVEGPDPLRIAIRPERSVALRLLTAERQPVGGVEVGLWPLDAAGVPVCEQDLRRGVTNRAGVVRFRHLQWPERYTPALREAAHCALRPGLPGCGALFATFSPAAPPAEPIELVLPACGSFVVRGPAGGVPPKGLISLREVGGCGLPVASRQPTTSELVFDHVPIGRRYEFQGDTARQVDGPTVAGEVVVVELDANAEVSITGSLLDESGRALAERDCSLLVRASGWFAPVTLRTDSTGRFSHTLPAWCAGRALRCVVHVRGNGAVAPTVAGPVYCVLVAGGNELGTLRAVAAEPLVAGRVVRHGDGERQQPDLLVERFDPEDGSWWRVEGLHTTHTASGFTIHGGGSLDGPLRLRCSDGFTLVGGPRTFVPGERDVVLEVRRPVPFEAHVRFDAALAPFVAVTLMPIDLPAAEFASLGLQPGSGVPVRGINLVEDRAVYQEDVPAGTYDLVFQAHGFPEVLARVDRIVVGGERPDPRLREVDLRGKLATLVVEVVDANGVDQQGRITALGATDLGEGSRLEMSSGETLLVPAGAHDLLVFWPDYPPVEVRGATGRVRVVVSPWRSADFVVHGLPPLPSGFSYWLDVGDPEPRDWSRLESYRTCVGGMERLENGRARVQLGDGPALVRLRIHRESDSTNEDLPPVQPDRVVAGEGPIELRAPSAEAILAALATLQAKPLR